MVLYYMLYCYICYSVRIYQNSKFLILKILSSSFCALFFLFYIRVVLLLRSYHIHHSPIAKEKKKDRKGRKGRYTKVDLEPVYTVLCVPVSCETKLKY